MEGIYDPFGYLKKVLNDKTKELGHDVQTVTLSIFKGAEKYVLFYFKNHSQLILKDFQDVLDDDATQQYRSFLEFVQSPRNQNEFDEKVIEDTVNAIVILHVIIKIKELSVIETKIIDNYDELKKMRSEYNCWYRGQSSIKWKLVPSFYRSLGSKTVTVDKTYLSTEYDRLKVIDRIRAVFNSTSLNYDQLAFIQHSMAFSPLLDFTTDILTAASFAVSNLVKPHFMQDEPAAIFSIKLNGNEEIIKDQEHCNPIIDRLNVEYIGSKPFVSTLIRSKMWNDLILGTIYSEYKLIDIKTNDRMRIQNGTFVLFNNVLIIGDDMIVSTRTRRAMSKIITKYEIRTDKNQRYNMYLEIMKNDKKYHLNFMMNPYEYMIQ